MGIGSVNLTTASKTLSQPPQPEGIALFIGKGKATPNAVLVGDDSNIATLISAAKPADSEDLIRAVELARQNGGNNWKAWVVGQAAPDAASMQQAIKTALAQHPIEMVVITEEPSDAAAVKAWGDFANSLATTKNHEVIFIIPVRGINNSTDASWSAYITVAKALLTGVVSNRLMVVPNLYGGEVGAFAGRLQQCVDGDQPSISRTPMRVMSGIVRGSFKHSTTVPLTDADGTVLTNTERATLSEAKLSVLQNYPSRQGLYFADGMVLSDESDAINRVEYRRAMDKAARGVRHALVSEIGRDFDGSLVESKAMEARITQPLQAMVDAGEILPLSSNSVVLSFLDNTSLSVGITIQPPLAPKTITANITLIRD